MKSVVITGVSTGIGYATAADLVQRGYHVFGSVRKWEDAERVQTELGANFTPLLFDVTDEMGVETAVAQITTHLKGQPLTALINNAGISTPGPLAHLSLAALRQQLEVNVVSVLHITQACLPLLKSEQSPGRIINISSVSGRIVYPFMGAYAASKHALEAMSDALRRELFIYGIAVVLIEPGTVRTPIVGKFGEQVAQFRGTDYEPFLAKLQEEVVERERKAMPVESVTAVIRTALEAANPKPRYPIPRRWLTGWLLPRWLPDSWFDKLVIRQLNNMRNR